MKTYKRNQQLLDPAKYIMYLIRKLKDMIRVVNNPPSSNWENKITIEQATAATWFKMMTENVTPDKYAVCIGVPQSTIDTFLEVVKPLETPKNTVQA